MITLYKYRGFSNFEFALDIFINQRLYAASFKNLNDPMEGQYIYSKGLLSQGRVAEIRGDKSRLKVLSLSETPKNMLMWSYYADAHGGFVVGVEMAERRAKPIQYVDDLRVANHREANAESILSRKLNLWEHERERRVFKSVEREGDPFVKVKVTELLFGLNSSGPKVDVLEAVARKFCPGIRVQRLSREDLDTGNTSPSSIPHERTPRRH